MHERPLIPLLDRLDAKVREPVTIVDHDIDQPTVVGTVALDGNTDLDGHVTVVVGDDLLKDVDDGHRYNRRLVSSVVHS